MRKLEIYRKNEAGKLYKSAQMQLASSWDLQEMIIDLANRPLVYIVYDNGLKWGVDNYNDKWSPPVYLDKNLIWLKSTKNDNKLINIKKWSNRTL